MTNANGKRVTLATIKSFIKKSSAAGNLYFQSKSNFDGMVDCVMETNGIMEKFRATEKNLQFTLGISGAWFVGRSSDHFREWSKDGYRGYEVYNCCGHFIIATK